MTLTSPMGQNALNRYSTVGTSGYNRFMGEQSSPLQYNVPARSIRGSAGRGSFNDGQGVSREDRVNNMVSQALEQFDAQTAIRQGIQSRMNADIQAAITPGLQAINQSGYGNDLSRYAYGGNTYSGDGYSRFMNSQSGQGLFGGTRTTPEQRYSAYNNEISRRGNIANQALTPAYAKYGLQSPTSRPMRVGFGGFLG